jgi:hypothetical protein
MEFRQIIKNTEKSKNKISNSVKQSFEKNGHPRNNLKHTEESKTKISLSRKGCVSPMQGKRHSLETIKKLSGVNHYRSKLSNSQIQEIKDLIALGIYTQREIATKFEVNESLISKIKHGHKEIL